MMKPHEKKAFEVGKNGGTVPTHGLPCKTKQEIDAAANKGKNSK